MAVTLGFLREYCREIASPDSSGLTAEREFMIWINSALNRVYLDGDWSGIERTKILTLPAETTGTCFVSNGSNTFALGAGTLPSDVSGDVVGGDGDGAYEILIDGQSENTFEVISGGGAAAGVLSHPYIGDTNPTATYWLFKNKLAFNANPIPTTNEKLVHRQVRKICLMWDTFQKREIFFRPPAEYERIRGINPTERAADPRFYTFRNGRVEFWPHPGIARQFRATYLVGAPYFLSTDGDPTRIDWPDDSRFGDPGGNPTAEIDGSFWVDLLQKAILVEAAITQGRDAVVPYPLAQAEYQERLRKYRSVDGNRIDQTGPLTPHLAHPMNVPFERSISDFREIPDV